MADVEVRIATEEDVEFLFPRLSAPDLAEVSAFGDPLSLLWDSYARSRPPRTGLINDERCCMFGVTPVTALSSFGVPWLLGTDLLARYPVTFLRYSRPYFEEMQATYRVLTNFVHDENVRSIRWLRWLGFEFSDYPAPIGQHGERFYQFQWRRD